MADYTTLDKVRALVPRDINIDETTDPTSAQVAVWITQVTARLDFALAEGGRTAPATDATELSAFDLLCAQEVAWMVMYRNNAAAADHEWHTTFEEELVRLVGELASTANVVHAPSSRTMDAVDDATDASLEPQFKRSRTY